MGDRSESERVCVVTGGSNGIGLAIVHGLLEALVVGDDNLVVYCLDVVPPTDERALKAIAKEQLVFLKTDVSKSTEFCLRLQHIHDTHHRLDCLVNNAGIFETSEMGNVLWDDATTIQQIDHLLMTNIGSVVHGTRMAVRFMRQADRGGGVIINIASTAALAPFADHAVYCSTKAAILHFSQTADADVQKQQQSSSSSSSQIRIHCVCPGIIDTDMGRMGGEANRLAVAKLQEGKRTSPKLVAQAVLGLFQQTCQEWMDASYLVVDNHEITPIFPSAEERSS